MAGMQKGCPGLYRKAERRWVDQRCIKPDRLKMALGQPIQGQVKIGRLWWEVDGRMVTEGRI